MGKRLQVREVTSAEREAVRRLAHSRTAPARAVERAQVVLAAVEEAMGGGGDGGGDRGAAPSSPPDGLSLGAPV